MKKQHGFTLVELMVVISLVALLMAWGIPAFSSWQQKHDVETEMSQLYSDLQFARMNAFGDKVTTGIWWDGQGAYHIAKNPVSSSGTQIGATVTPKYAIQGQTTVSFNSRGFRDSPANTVTFYVANNYGAPTDCVSVSLTMITLGKMNGGKCYPPQ